MSSETEGRIAALEAAVAELRERDPGTRTMHRTHRCPACGGTKLFHFVRVKEEAQQEVVDLALNKRYRRFAGVMRSDGELGAFACRNCRLVEWHAVSLDDVMPDGKNILEIDGDESAPPASSPYR
jgi:hypothetical protein